MVRPPPRPPLFPYTTLFRSRAPRPGGRDRPADRRRGRPDGAALAGPRELDRKSTRLNSSHLVISYAVFCLKKKTTAQRDFEVVRAQQRVLGASAVKNYAYIS